MEERGNSMKKTELINALKTVEPGLSDSGVYRQSDCFVFTDGKVVTFNDDIAAHYPIDVGVEGAVKAKEFMSILTKIKEDDIKIKAEKGAFRIYGKNFDSGIVMENEIVLEMGFLENNIKYKKIPDNFFDAMKICAKTADPSRKNSIYACVRIIGDMVESCDNYRATRYRIDTDMGKEVLIPTDSALTISNMDFEKYGVSNGWVHFKKKNGAVVSTRTFGQEWNPTDVFFDITGSKAIVLPDELSHVLDLGDVFASDDSGRVFITIEPKKCTVCGQNSNGWYKETISVRTKIERIDFEISVDVLKDILKITNKAKVADRVMHFKCKKFNHVVALIPPQK